VVVELCLHCLRFWSMVLGLFRKVYS